MHKFMVTIYVDHAPRLFTVAKFVDVIATDKDAAREWGKWVADRLAIHKPSVHVEWLGEVK